MATIMVTQNQGFDQTYYLSAKAAQLTASTGQPWTVASVQAAFDAANLTAEQHYSLYGYNEGLSPNAFYNDDYYALSKASAANMTADEFRLAWYTASGSDNLYTHYMQYGAYENGVNPSGGFNDQAYYEAKAVQMGGGATWEDARDAIQAAGLNAVSHYLLYGQAEGVNYDPTPINPPDTTVTLTTGADTFSANVFDAPSITASMTGILVDTLQNVDNLTGSGTNPTLNATLGTATIAKPTMTGVETINLTNISGGLGVTLDLGASTGVKALNLDANYSNGNDITVQGVKTNVPIALKNMQGAATDAPIRFDDAVLASTADTVALSLTNLGTGTNAVGATGAINVSGMSAGVAETLAVTVNGVNNVTNITSALPGGQNGATTIKFAGKDGQITVQNQLTNVTTVDASGLTGTGRMIVSVDPTKDITATGGEGNDSVNFANGLTIADKYDGGAGRDTIRVNADNGGLGVGNHISNVEILRADGAASFTFDHDNATSIDAIVQNSAAAMTFNNMLGADAADATKGLTLTGVGATAYNIKGAGTGTADTLSVTIGTATGTTGVNLGANAGALTSTGLETLNINVVANDHSLGGLTATGIGTISDNATGSLTKMNITGGEIATNFVVNAGAANATANLATIDASTFVGNLTVTGNNIANATILGGSGNDTLAGNAQNDTIKGNAGNDRITGAANADTLTGGDGVDTFVYTTATDSSTAGGTLNVDKLMDFTSGTDHLDLGGVITTLNQGATMVATSTGSDVAALRADVATAIAAGGGTYANTDANVVTITGSGGDAGTYVYVDSDNSGTVTANDLIVQLSGTSSHSLALADFV